MLNHGYESSILEAEFKNQLSSLKDGQFSNDEFFYRDFTAEEQFSIAKIIGHRAGFITLNEAELVSLKSNFDNAYKRIETKYNLS